MDPQQRRCPVLDHARRAPRGSERARQAGFRASGMPRPWSRTRWMEWSDRRGRRGRALAWDAVRRLLGTALALAVSAGVRAAPAAAAGPIAASSAQLMPGRSTGAVAFGRTCSSCRCGSDPSGPGGSVSPRSPRRAAGFGRAAVRQRPADAICAVAGGRFRACRTSPRAFPPASRRSAGWRERGEDRARSAELRHRRPGRRRDPRPVHAARPAHGEWRAIVRHRRSVRWRHACRTAGRVPGKPACAPRQLATGA